MTTTRLLNSFFSISARRIVQDLLAFALLHLDVVENYDQGSWDKLIWQRIFHV
jgi:hypothetical protein